MLVVNREKHEIRSQSFTSSCAQYFRFCLQCAEAFLQRVIPLFAACGSVICSVRKFLFFFAAFNYFVCSVVEFCLQCAGVCLQRVILLFAACWSCVCSVREFRLQRVIVLFAACNSLAWSVHVPFLQFLFFVCSVQELIFFWRVIYACKEYFYL